ncbi:hypothetical protein BFP46_22565 [Bacillus licheniformis]|jgi:hypothetical protein|nr:hypothetical protein BFP46_22565 [Bacillus licheniformis]
MTKQKKGNTPITSVRFTQADRILLSELVKHYNEVYDWYPRVDMTSMLRLLIRKEHEKIFS